MSYTLFRKQKYNGADEKEDLLIYCSHSWVYWGVGVVGLIVMAIVILHKYCL